MELTYRMNGDYLLPNLASPAPNRIGKYGMLRKTFLKNERKGFYAQLLLSEQLDSHLAEMDRTEREQVEWNDTQPRISRSSIGLDKPYERPEATSR